MTDSILIIDDDVTVLRQLGTFFEQHGWDVYRELSGEAGVTTFDRTLADVVLVGLKLPGIDGFEVLNRLRGRETAVIVLTSDGDVPTAVRAMQSGAENFLTKPIDLSQLKVTADRAVEKVRLRRVNRTLIGQSSTAEGLDSLGTSALMREVARQVTLLAHGDRAAVLLQGEPGTGKRWVARLLHD
ncbi:MAG: response regulator, partial [Gemmatimonadota bacterium]